MQDHISSLVSLYQFNIIDLNMETFAKVLTNHKKIFMFFPGSDSSFSKDAEANFEKALPQLDALSKV
jgi:hypothetical protein